VLVGQANRILDLIAVLDSPKLPEICDVVYDNLCTMFAARGHVYFIRRRDSELTPNPAPECQLR
jgi:hypothetical protein